MSSYREKYPERVRENERKRRQKLRLDVLLHYSGGELECASCGTKDSRVLDIDHIDGGGLAHRRAIGVSGGVGFHRWLKKNDYPHGYRVLCKNCNWLARLGVSL